MGTGSRVAVAALAMVVAASWAASQEQEGAIIAPLAARSLLLDVTAAGDRLVAVGERGHVLVSTDGGTNWRQVPVPTRVMLTAVSFCDGLVGVGAGHDAMILRTADGGETFRQVYNDPEADSPLFDVACFDGTRAFAIGAYGLFLESRDGGETWERRTLSDDDAHLHHLARSESGRLYIAAERGVVLGSDDGGEKWSELPSPYMGSLFGTLPLDGAGVLLFGLRGHAFRSGDGGASWLPIGTGVDAMLTGACRLADGRIVMVGLAGVVLVSNDDGRSFVLAEQRDRLGISSVIPTPDGEVVMTGEFGVRKLPVKATAAPAGREGER
jgi:photosystem II stability/assembly factor-like uncharacterized protein